MEKRRHTSVGQKLKKAKSLETKAAIASEWAESWQQEHAKLFRNLERALQIDDYDLLCRAVGQLKEANVKRLDVLPRVINQLTDRDQRKVDE